MSENKSTNESKKAIKQQSAVNTHRLQAVHQINTFSYSHNNDKCCKSENLTHSHTYNHLNTHVTNKKMTISKQLQLEPSNTLITSSCSSSSSPPQLLLQSRTRNDITHKQQERRQRRQQEHQQEFEEQQNKTCLFSPPIHVRWAAKAELVHCRVQYLQHERERLTHQREMLLDTMESAVNEHESQMRRLKEQITESERLHVSIVETLNNRREKCAERRQEVNNTIVAIHHNVKERQRMRDELREQLVLETDKVNEAQRELNKAHATYEDVTSELHEHEKEESKMSDDAYGLHGEAKDAIMHIKSLDKTKEEVKHDAMTAELHRRVLFSRCEELKGKIRVYCRVKGIQEVLLEGCKDCTNNCNTDNNINDGVELDEISRVRMHVNGNQELEQQQQEEEECCYCNHGRTSRCKRQRSSSSQAAIRTNAQKSKENLHNLLSSVSVEYASEPSAECAIKKRNVESSTVNRMHTSTSAVPSEKTDNIINFTDSSNHFTVDNEISSHAIIDSKLHGNNICNTAATTTSTTTITTINTTTITSSSSKKGENISCNVSESVERNIELLNNKLESSMTPTRSSATSMLESSLSPSPQPRHWESHERLFECDRKLKYNDNNCIMLKKLPYSPKINDKEEEEEYEEYKSEQLQERNELMTSNGPMQIDRNEYADSDETYEFSLPTQKARLERSNEQNRRNNVKSNIITVTDESYVTHNNSNNNNKNNNHCTLSLQQSNSDAEENVNQIFSFANPRVCEDDNSNNNNNTCSMDNNGNDVNKNDATVLTSTSTIDVQAQKDNGSSKSGNVFRTITVHQSRPNATSTGIIESSESFRYDCVFAPSSTQAEIYRDVEPLVLNAIDGYRICVFAYGQTGSGKTYTMEGNLHSTSSYGVIPRAMETIFRRQAELVDEGWSYELSCTILEIHNESIYDLTQNPSIYINATPSSSSSISTLQRNKLDKTRSLEPSKNSCTTTTTTSKKEETEFSNLYDRENDKGCEQIMYKQNNSSNSKSNMSSKCYHTIRHNSEGTFVSNVHEHKLRNMHEFQQVYKRAICNRHTAKTLLNTSSSRSHCIFTLHIHGVNATVRQRSRGVLCLVDLAGSERVNESGVTGNQFKEAVKINRSLLDLGKCITAMRTNAVVPWRNSLLTYLLQNYMNAKGAKTLMIVTVSDQLAHLPESVNSLRFAQRVQQTLIGKSVKQITNY